LTLIEEFIAPYLLKPSSKNKAMKMHFRKLAVGIAVAMIFSPSVSIAQTKSDCQVLAKGFNAIVGGFSGLTNSLVDIGKGVPAMEANASAEAKSLINNFDQKRKNAAEALTEFLNASRELRNFYEKCS
jgi:hypothetical protein